MKEYNQAKFTKASARLQPRVYDIAASGSRMNAAGGDCMENTRLEPRAS